MVSSEYSGAWRGGGYGPLAPFGLSDKGALVHWSLPRLDMVAIAPPLQLLVEVWSLSSVDCLRLGTNALLSY